ncbi:MAG: DNA translocase FtsK, partial [Clostridia bacterium]|nr:DNA translocase FtsK [Clostridia bacterium]
MAPKKVQKKPAAKKRVVKKKKPNKHLRGEASGLIFLAVGVIMFLSVFFKNSMGPIGELLGRHAGGLFGLTGYLIPVLIMIHSFIKIFKPHLLNENRRFSMILVLMMLISAMLQAGLHDIAYYENMNLLQYINAFYREGLRAVGKGATGFVASGGAFGGIIGVPLLFVFKKWGTMIILTTLSIIVALLITRLSIAETARNIKRGTSEAFNSMVDAARKKRDNWELRRSLNAMADEESAASATSPPERKKRGRVGVADFTLEAQANAEQMAAKGMRKESSKESSQKDAYSKLGEKVQQAQNESLQKEPATEQNAPFEFDLSTQPSSLTFEIQEVGIGGDSASEPVSTNTSAPAEKTQRKPKAKPEEAQAASAPIPSTTEALGYTIEKSDKYLYPPVELLSKSSEGESNMNKIKAAAVDNAKKLESTLESFGIGAKVINVSVGPAFTRYELQPAPGIKAVSYTH